MNRFFAAICCLVLMSRAKVAVQSAACSSLCVYYPYGATFSVECGLPDVQGVWYHNGTKLSREPRHSYSGNATFEAAGEYTCRNPSTNSTIITTSIRVFAHQGIQPLQCDSLSNNICVRNIPRGQTVKLCSQLVTHPSSISGGTEVNSIVGSKWKDSNSTVIVQCRRKDNCTTTVPLDSGKVELEGDWALCVTVHNVTSTQSYRYSLTRQHSHKSSFLPHAFTFRVNPVDRESSPPPVPSSPLPTSAPPHTQQVTTGGSTAAPTSHPTLPEEESTLPISIPVAVGVAVGVALIIMIIVIILAIYFYIRRNREGKSSSDYIKPGKSKCLANQKVKGGRFGLIESGQPVQLTRATPTLSTTGLITAPPIGSEEGDNSGESCVLSAHTVSTVTPITPASLNTMTCLTDGEIVKDNSPSSLSSSLSTSSFSKSSQSKGNTIVQPVATVASSGSYITSKHNNAASCHPHIATSDPSKQSSRPSPVSRPTKLGLGDSAPKKAELRLEEELDESLFAGGLTGPYSHVEM